MQHIVVAGGTAGMGRGIALNYLAKGAHVTVIGRDPTRGRRFLDDAAAVDASGRAAFIQADLTSVAENRRAIAVVRQRHDSLDALVHTAMSVSRRRVESPEGYDAAFALYYISRFVLGYGLTDLLETATSPVIVSVGGVGITKGRIHWDDMRLRDSYGMLRATLQGGRAADLLGVAYALNHPDGRTRYLLHHPGYTDSGYEALRQPWRSYMKLQAKAFARPVERSIEPIIELMEHPPAQRLIAYDRRTPVDATLRTLDPGDARRLYEQTRHLLGD